MKIAILNDTHAGIRQSSEIFIEYQRKFYEDVFFPYLSKHDIKHILHLGDYFDNRKSINFKALHANRRMFLDVLREENIHLDIFPGNHDTTFANTSDICSLKELMGYYLDEVKIYMRPTAVDYEGYNIALVPWVNRENLDEIRSFMKGLDPNEISLVAGHFELGGFEMMKGVFSHENTESITMADLRPFKKVISGHFHKKSRQRNVTYLGAQMQFTWSDCGEKKYFHVLDTETNIIGAVRNPVEIYARIDYNDAEDIDWDTYDVTQYEQKYVKIYVINKTDPMKFNNFLDRLYQVETHDLKVIENFQGLVAHNHGDSEDSTLSTTEEIIDQYINDFELMDENYSKEIIKSKFNSLYNSAMMGEM